MSTIPYKSGIFALSALLLLGGCFGGGDGDDESSGSSSNLTPTATFTRAEAPTVATAAVGTAVNASDMASPDKLTSTTQIGGTGIATKSLLLTQSVSTLGSRDTMTQKCDEGSMTFDESVNTSTMTYDHCVWKELGMELNGKLVHTVVDTTHDRVEAVNFSMIAPSFEILMKSLTTNITYADASRKTLKEMSSTMTTTYTVKNEVEEEMKKGVYQLENFRLSMTDLDTPTYHMTMNGMLSTPCTGGWLEIKTVTPIALENSEKESCPVGGEVEVLGAGGSKAKVLIHADQNIEIFYDDESTPVKQYASCEEMEDPCEVSVE